MKKQLHIIAFNVPDPPDYGGVMDVFYRIEALHEIGVEITLHCFQYGRQKSERLESICKQVYYYPRKVTFLKQISLLPFIVNTRMDKKLLDNLCLDDNPILFEGLHCCGYIKNPRLAQRFKMVRAHNKEHDYYRKLAYQSNQIFKIIYFFLESLKLKMFERKLNSANHIFSISSEEQDYFMRTYKHSSLMLPFHPNRNVLMAPGRGNYILYHGNLEVEENAESARFLMEEIAPLIEQEILIAGNNPGESLYKMAIKHHNVNIIASPNSDEMLHLIQNAHINLLITFQDTGFKLKLINALYNGRFCLVNQKMVRGTGLDSLCVVRNTVNELVEEIENIFLLDFKNEMIDKREVLLKQAASNMDNAHSIVKQIPDFSK